MEEIPNQTAPEATNTQDQKLRVPFIIFALALFTVFLYGLYWIFTQSTNSPIGAGWFLFSFAAGLSMIVLPCTLPLAFVIVPLSMGKGYVKGFSVALAFGLGVAITLSMYGILAALLGKALFGFTDGGGETIKNIFYTIAGIFALVFALGELGLLKARMPSYMGAVPGFIQKRKDIAKALMLGLFLGNIGVGCPHPATPIILGQIGVTHDVFYGWLLFFVHAVGRVIPLLFLAVLGILGVNATKSLVKHKDSIARATAWGMVFVGAFLFTLGFFSHDWWVNSGSHTLLEEITQEARFTDALNERFQSAVAHRHGLEEGAGFFGAPLWLGNWVLVVLMAIPLWWYWFFRRNRMSSLSETERGAEQEALRSKAILFATATVLFALTFIYVLPQRFLAQQAALEAQEHAVPSAGSVDMGDMHDMDAMGSMNASDLSRLSLRTPANAIARLPFAVAEDGTKEFHLEAGEFRWEYAKGSSVHAWGYNGQVPGPEIRVMEGDRVRVVLTNNLPEATSMHWHGIDVPYTQDGVPGFSQVATKPGETRVYEFEAKPAGTRFYHTHGSSHGTEAMQLDMGLAGAFIIEPKNFTRPDKDITLILDEWAVGAGGTNMAATMGHDMGDAAPSAGVGHAMMDYGVFTVNGRTFPDVPAISVKEGERVRLRLINAGTSTIHPMHLHGHQFKVTATDGNPVPLAAQLTKNTIALNPGETYDIEFVAENPGVWVFHCHELHHAGGGMIMPILYEGYKPLGQ